MAGAGYKLFNTGDVLTAAQVNTYLQEQAVMRFASAAARTTALSGVLAEGMVSYLMDTNAVEVYDGSAWVGVATGDITAVTAGTGITGGGTSGAVTITNAMATEITAAGDIIVGTGSGTFDNLPIGTTGQVLTADTTVSPYKVKWASAASGGGMTSLATGTLASAVEGASITSISGSYNHLQLFVYGYQFSQDGYLAFRFNSDSTSNIYQCSIQNFDNSGTSVDENFSGLTAVSGNGNYSANLNGTGYIACLDLFNYASTSMQKHFRLTVSDEANSGSPYVSRVITGRYKSTSAVTSVQIRTEGTPTTFAAGSYLLYGVK